jgi:hypothetical protein
LKYHFVVGAKQGSSALPAFDIRGKKGEAGEAFASPLLKILCHRTKAKDRWNRKGLH